MEAMEKLKAGVRFSEVASQYSEDKARQGVRPCISYLIHLTVMSFISGTGQTNCRETFIHFCSVDAAVRFLAMRNDVSVKDFTQIFKNNSIIVITLVYFL